MKTKLEAALVLLNMAQTETDEGRRDALLVCIHHTVRRKLHDDRYKASRTARGLKVWNGAQPSADAVYITPPIVAAPEAAEIPAVPAVMEA